MTDRFEPPANQPQEPSQQGWQPPQHPFQQGWQPPQEQSQQGWQAPQPGQQPAGQAWPPPEDMLVQPQPPKRNGKLIVAAAGAVVLLGGGVATYAAVSSSKDAAGGASTPVAAVRKLVDDLNHSDVLAALGDLPPNERDAVLTPYKRTVTQLERNHLVPVGTTPSKLQGATFTAKNLGYGAVVKLTGQVSSVPVTAGTITVTGKAERNPLSGIFGAGGMASAGGSGTMRKTVKLADVAAKNGHPLRIAVQHVGNQWYPSMFYSIADNAATQAGQQIPTTPLPAVGASSADDAVRTEVRSLLSGDVRRSLELLSPKELAVVHDYGNLILRNTHPDRSTARVESLSLHDTVVDGGTLVSLRSLTVVSGGTRFSLKINGSCVDVTAEGNTQHQCAAQYAQLFAQGRTLTTAQKRAIGDLFAGISRIGVLTTSTGGTWFVNPVRSVASIGETLLSGLKGGDGEALAKLFKR